MTQLADLIEAVSQFASRAAEKLRKQERRAGQVLCFIRTSPFRRDDKQYSRSVTGPLRRRPSARANRHQVFLPVSPLGPKNERAGMMQRRPRRHATSELRTRYEEGKMKTYFPFYPVRAGDLPTNDQGNTSVNHTIERKEHARAPQSALAASTLHPSAVLALCGLLAAGST